MIKLRIFYRNAMPDDMPEIASLIRSVSGDDRKLDHRQFRIACHINKVIGCIRTIQAEKDCKEIASLVVSPEYRRQGIGTTLVKQLLKKDTFRPLHLICKRQKSPFYRQHKFRETDFNSIPATLKRDFRQMREKISQDLVVMELK